MNFLRTSWRNLTKTRGLAAIYITGLSISVAAAMLIFTWIRYQLSFDRGIPNAENIYRVYPHIYMHGNNFTTSMAPPPLASLLKKEFPEVLAVTRIWKYNNLAVSNDENGRRDKAFNEEVYQADSSFFQIFNYRLLQGNAAASMTRPFTVVINRSTAIKYFGEEAFWNGSIPGKALTLTFGGWGKFPCKITGITEDVPAHSHFHYNIIFSNVSDPWNGSTVWVDNTYYTYVRLRDGAPPGELEKKIPAAIRPFLEPQLKSNFGTSYADLKKGGNYWEYKLQPLTDIHLHSNSERELEPGEPMENLYILGVAALFLLIMAGINYANLATVSSIRRSREIGVRKTLGSSRKGLVLLALAESVLIGMMAWIAAFVLMLVLRQPFERMMKTELPGSAYFNGLNGVVFIGLFLSMSILGGIYPALQLTSFPVVKALKGPIMPGKRFLGFKSGLVVAQFFLFIGLVIAALLVNRQLSWMLQRSPGFDRENMLVIEDPSQLLGKKSDAFLAEIGRDPEVISANPCVDYPGSGNDNFPISARYGGRGPDHLLANFAAGYDFLRTFDIPLIQGRDFNRQMDNDTLRRIILSEAAVKELGIRDPIGSVIETRYLNSLNITNTRYEIVGVTRNFNFQSLHKAIRPIAIFLNTEGVYVAVKIKGGDVVHTLAGIENAWRRFVPGAPFEFHFVEGKVDNMYRTESVLRNVLNVLTALIVLVAVLGLIGLTLLTVQQRTKEIGIRKVIGASVKDILLLFSREYIKWVGVSFVFAAPVAWFVMQKWLQSFAYRVPLEWWVFAGAGVLALGIAVVTVSLQVLGAAMASPVKALKTE
jgi:putative ABC transport system permease protein